MKKTFTWLFCAVMVTGYVSTAGAAGFGVYGSLGSGSADWTLTDSYSGTGTNTTFKTDSDHEGAGFVFDTALARDSFFNYQLNLGYDKFTSKIVDTGETLDMSGLMISNSFGFGIVRTSGYRLWLGPEIRLAWPKGSQDGYDYDFFGIGIGPVIGMNFNTPGAVVFQVKAGYQMMSYTGEANATGSSYGYADYDLDERLIYVNVGILFRSSGDFF
jgi:hypothetical protein